MAGIYIHIPFCRQACHYCDFHFSTNLKPQNEMVDAITKEISSRRDYISEPVSTIYFGGGTPSILETNQIDQLLQVVFKNFEVDARPEITLEANPEDLTEEKAEELKKLGINRLSVGVQTFDSEKLKWMNRVHNSDEILTAFEHSRKAGFDNISLDLIYAIPDHSTKRWEADLQAAVDLSPEHISLYGLTIESGTVFGKWELKNKLIQVREDEAANQYLFAIAFFRNHGYQQYEVSNFGKKNFHSRHNNAYWSGIPYLGVGPGAHSFDGRERRFNVRSNQKYLKALAVGNQYFESETLSEIQLINEQVLTQLRTSKGLDITKIDSQLNADFIAMKSDFLKEMQHQDLIEIKNGFLSLRPNGFLVADEIALRLFL